MFLTLVRRGHNPGVHNLHFADFAVATQGEELLCLFEPLIRLGLALHGRDLVEARERNVSPKNVAGPFQKRFEHVVPPESLR